MTTIRVSEANRARLAKFGYAGESFDDALGRVLTIAEEYQNEKMRRQDPHKAAIPAFA